MEAKLGNTGQKWTEGTTVEPHLLGDEVTRHRQNQRNENSKDRRPNVHRWPWTRRSDIRRVWQSERTAQNVGNAKPSRLKTRASAISDRASEEWSNGVRIQGHLLQGARLRSSSALWLKGRYFLVFNVSRLKHFIFHEFKFVAESLFVCHIMSCDRTCVHAKALMLTC